MDLIVQRDGVLRFVEVKLRDPSDLAGLEGINLSRVRNAAEIWLADYEDVVDEACLWLAWVTHRQGRFDIEWLLDP